MDFHALHCPPHNTKETKDTIRFGLFSAACID
jgi:hypothetical protein